MIKDIQVLAVFPVHLKAIPKQVRGRDAGQIKGKQNVDYMENKQMKIGGINMNLSQPHGGILVNRWDPNFKYETITEKVELDEIAISDLDLLGVGAYSPLKGFL